jgi:putative DeoR family transcriptional regulator (stage III sporulation protein D)
MNNIYDRAKQMARYLISTNSTVRKTAKVFGVSKSTVHFDLTKRLPKANYFLYLKVKKILEKNFAEKSFRGGEATKNKYKNQKTKMVAI